MVEPTLSECPPQSPTGVIRAQPGNADWHPYCMRCETFGRMTETPFGFKCEGIGDHFGRMGCGNEIGWDLMRLSTEAGRTMLEGDDRG